MSFRVRGKVVGYEFQGGEATVAVATGELVALQADGKVLKADTRNGVAYYPVVENSAIGCNVASAQLTGVANVKIKDGVTVNAGDVIIADTTTAEGIVGAVTDKEANIFIGVAQAPAVGGFAPVLMRV